MSFKDVTFEPKPVQKPHLPIWIGGDAEPMLKRAARYASGWFPWLTQPNVIPAKLDFIKSQSTYDGRPFEVLYGLGSSQSAKDMSSSTTPPNGPACPQKKSSTSSVRSPSWA